MEWFFDGLGTELISLLIGTVFGGVVGWKLSIHRFSQKQRAGDNSTQTQVGGNQRITQGK